MDVRQDKGQSKRVERSNPHEDEKKTLCSGLFPGCRADSPSDRMRRAGGRCAAGHRHPHPERQPGNPDRVRRGGQGARPDRPQRGRQGHRGGLHRLHREGLRRGPAGPDRGDPRGRLLRGGRGRQRKEHRPAAGAGLRAPGRRLPGGDVRQHAGRGPGAGPFLRHRDHRQRGLRPGLCAGRAAVALHHPGEGAGDRARPGERPGGGGRVRRQGLRSRRRHPDLRAGIYRQRKRV